MHISKGETWRFVFGSKSIGDRIFLLPRCADLKGPGVNIDSDQDANTLKSLRVRIKTKRSGRLTNGVIRLKDHA